jgi:hypothetical protein
MYLLEKFLSFLARWVREVRRHVQDAFNERVSGMSSQAYIEFSAGADDGVFVTASRPSLRT